MPDSENRPIGQVSSIVSLQVHMTSPSDETATSSPQTANEHRARVSLQHWLGRYDNCSCNGSETPLAQQPAVSLLTQVRERVPDSSLPVIINVPRLPAYRFNCPDKRLISPTPCVLQSPLYVPCRPPMARLGPDEYIQQCLSFTLIVESVAARRDPQRRSDHGWNRGLVG